MLLIAAALAGAAGWLVVRSGALPPSLRTWEHAMIRTFKRWHHGPAAALAIATGAPGSTAPLTVPPTQIGISLSPPGNGQIYANLAKGGRWVLAPDGGRWEKLPIENLDANGELKVVPPNATVKRVLAEPVLGKDGVGVTCTYQGRGDVSISGPPVGDPTRREGNFHFRWTTLHPAATVTINITKIDAAQPIRNLDCRVDGTSKDALFAPELLSIIRGFRILRFMDWQNTNANLAVTWTTRHTSQSFDSSGRDGIPIEDMVKLAILNGSDAWFNMPWNADDDYIRHFAQYVHDTLPNDRTVYVECSNEVWNWAFPVSRQAAQEGLDQHLGIDQKSALMHRYAQRLVQVMDIWASVFKDNPKRLVRVGASQHAVTDKTTLVLDYKDTSKHIDAFATAPYFNIDSNIDAKSDDQIFDSLSSRLIQSINQSEKQKTLSESHGLRYIAYESGQGVVLKDINLQKKIQRDNRMYELYKNYIERWRAQIGDSIILYGTVFSIRESGAWGLIEHDGQPPSEAPKLRAVREWLDIH